MPDCRVTVSIGITTMDNQDNSTSIMAKADRALYASKSHGKNFTTHFVNLTGDTIVSELPKKLNKKNC